MRASAWRQPMTTLIRDDHLPAADRAAFWREAAEQAWVPMRCELDDEAGYRAVMRVSGLGVMRVTLIDGMPVRLHRTPAHIRRADPDLLKLVLLVRGPGPIMVSQGGNTACLGPAEFVFYDTRRPFEVLFGAGEGGRVRGLTFMFPRSALPLPAAQLARLTGVRIPTTAGLGSLTSRFLMQLARDIDHYSPAEAARLSAAALEVLATRLAHEAGADGWASPEARRQALLTSVHAFIGQHLHDPGLSPPMVAAAHHISLRYLHKLFQGEGSTVAGSIRRRRLEGCRRDLADPALAAAPVSAIGRRWGFASPSDFSRAFRAAHGMSPLEYRRWARLAGVHAM
ncbi:helix-turn-helix domain-containing protein [Nonomuraea sp. NPDC048826]|uniref:AraC-like ligand-binding domain-containing protein n=1 Tax=Nonomuraea sp. NPDC048826 TaxID=3364347 RepID=UPI00371A8A91